MSPGLHGPSGSEWGRLWDPANFLPFAKIPFLWVDGTNDRAFPLDHVMRSAALAEGPSFFCTRLRMVHAHGPAGEAPPEILDFADYFARDGRPPVHIEKSCLRDGKISCRFDARGRRLARAELLWTCSAEDVDNGSRQWESVAIRDFAPTSGEVSADLPAGTVQALINLVDSDGLIFSSPTMKASRGDAEASFAERNPLQEKAESLERKIASRHKIYVSDSWGGGHRIIFDFDGRKAWIVEPRRAADGVPWIWTMQWMGAYLDRTGAPRLVGWHSDPDAEWDISGAWTEEHQARVFYEKLMRAWKARDRVCGQFLWTFFPHENPGRTARIEEGYRVVDKIGPGPQLAARLAEGPTK